jgi:lipopolysaccharide biosynthesis glycosyltransferase
MINFLICADSTDWNAFVYIPTLLNSISINHKESTVFLFYKDMGSTDKNNILNLLPTNIHLYFIEITKKIDTSQSNKIACHVKSPAMYFRLFAPELLPEIDKIIFMDLDVIVDGNLEPMLNFTDSKSGIAACIDIYRPSINQMMSSNFYSTIPLVFNPDFAAFNCGVMLMELNKMRDNNATEMMFKILSENFMSDQPLINLYCKGDFDRLPIKYNFPANHYTRPQFKALWDISPILIHWNGEKKPWNRKNNPQPIDQLYWKYDIKTRGNNYDFR